VRKCARLEEFILNLKRDFKNYSGLVTVFNISEGKGLKTQFFSGFGTLFWFFGASGHSFYGF
jgi:hypothetical protein